MSAPLLSVRDLSVSYATERGPARALDRLSIEVPAKATVAVVGESGSGKTTLALAILRLLTEPPARIDGGSILFEGQDLLKLDERALCKVRGGRIGMVFQEPMTSLNPVYTAGFQIAEAIRLHREVSRSVARDLAIEGLAKVGLPEPRRHVDSYPHELSGGMRQRVLLAIALACDPALVIADEPTSALDTTLQVELLDRLAEHRDRTGASVLLIAHDLALVAGVADEIVVLYAGVVVEQGPASAVLEAPLHPYTQALVASVPPRSPRVRGQRRKLLPVLAGAPPDPCAKPVGCGFAPRCPIVTDPCREEAPEFVSVDGREARCFAVAPSRLTVPFEMARRAEAE